MLGFRAQRPEKEFGNGPDVLWRTDDEFDFVIEVKSGKDTDTPLKKSEHGQLLVSKEWFRKQYPERDFVAFIVHPNEKATDNASAEGRICLTLDELNEITSTFRDVLESLVNGPYSGAAAEQQCGQMLREGNLDAAGIAQARLSSFSVVGADQRVPSTGP